MLSTSFREGLLDTDVLVSAFATRGLCTDLFHTIVAEHDLVLGETVVAEMRRVLADKLRVPQANGQEIDARPAQGRLLGGAQALPHSALAPRAALMRSASAPKDVRAYSAPDITTRGSVYSWPDRSVPFTVP